MKLSGRVWFVINDGWVSNGISYNSSNIKIVSLYLDLKRFLAQVPI